MDSNDEDMVATLLEEEIDVAATNDDKHMKIHFCLLGTYTRDLKRRCGGLRPWRCKSKPRQRLEGYCMLYTHYFVDYPPHEDVVFCKLFMKIVFAVKEFDAYFVCKQDCVGTIGFSLIEKCTIDLKMLAYGAHADTHDDYLPMAESTAIECMYRFSA
jgi:hypothetical protein